MKFFLFLLAYAVVTMSILGLSPEVSTFLFFAVLIAYEFGQKRKK